MRHNQPAQQQEKLLKQEEICTMHDMGNENVDAGKHAYILCIVNLLISVWNHFCFSCYFTAFRQKGTGVLKQF